MFRSKSTIGFVVRVACVGAGLSSLMACGAEPPATSVQASRDAELTGELSIPLIADVDGRRYRLARASFAITGDELGTLVHSDDPDEPVLSVTLPVGAYTSELLTWTLERAEGSGRFSPVDATLVSSAERPFQIANGSTTTISYRFETDGAIVTVGAGSLHVTIEVEQVAGVCTPFGSDCEAGSWCPPSELTGAPLACMPAGSLPLGAACRAPSECGANASCVDFGAGPSCTALCADAGVGMACAEGGTCERAGADYGVCKPEGADALACPLSRERWPAPGALDVVFDARRCKLYATVGGAIVSYDLRQHEAEPLVELGSPLMGLDISADQNTLIAADASTLGEDEPAQNRVHSIDLQTGATRALTFPLAFFEAGTYMPLFLDAATALVSSSFAGSGWVPLRRVSLIDGSFEELASVRQDTMLALSADGGTVAYAESNISSGEFGRYSVADGGLVEGLAFGFVSSIAVNRDGTRYALPMFDGVRLFSSSGPASGFEARGVLGGGGSAAGAAYSPTEEVLYVIWYRSTSIDAYDAASLEAGSFEPLFTIDTGFPLDFGAGLGRGRLRISADGRLLMAIVDDGVRTYPVGHR
jgi:hypothetical protein